MRICQRLDYWSAKASALVIERYDLMGQRQADTSKDKRDARSVVCLLTGMAYTALVVELD
jgi:hypothetical protein